MALGKQMMAPYFTSAMVEKAGTETIMAHSTLASTVGLAKVFNKSAQDRALEGLPLRNSP